MHTQTAVMVDLVGYSHHAAIVEAELGVAATAMLNRQVQDLIRLGLKGAGASADALVTDTGDGALLVFGAADQALAFAEALHNASFNSFHDRNGVRRYFRIGMATGDIFVDRSGTGRSMSPPSMLRWPWLRLAVISKRLIA